MSGATVSFKGTANAVITDNEGAYNIEVPDDITNPVLVISSVGYVSQEIILKGRTNLDINLQVDIRKLDGVVVIGYGTQRRKDLTGSIASISAAQIQ